MSVAAGPLRRALGLMSGTSMDGIDVALIETDGRDVLRFGPTGSEPYRDGDRALLRAALHEAASLRDRTARPGLLAAAERLVTDRHVAAVERFLRDHAVERHSIDVVGFHGQTVLHRPQDALTVQIGDAAALARQLGIDVVGDLRAADMVAGGQGAPLVPAFHRALAGASALEGPVLIVNVGGVSNITFLPGRGLDPIACDTGPGNALVDDLMLERTGQPLDRDGIAAGRGRVDAAALTQLLGHPYFQAPAPKSLDRNAFSRQPVAHLPTDDAAATLVAFTAATIAGMLRHLPASPRSAVVCGGGARNPTLMAALAAHLPCPVGTAEALGWSGDAVEAQAFAYLAVRSLDGLPLTFPTTTGVHDATTGGVLFRGGPDRSVGRAIAS